MRPSAKTLTLKDKIEGVFAISLLFAIILYIVWYPREYHLDIMDKGGLRLELLLVKEGVIDHGAYLRVGTKEKTELFRIGSVDPKYLESSLVDRGNYVECQVRGDNWGVYHPQTNTFISRGETQKGVWSSKKTGKP